MQQNLTQFFATERYQVERVLGQQRGRQTLLAHDQQTGDQVVIKGILFGPDFDWSDLKHFEREAQVLQQLNHSAIPKYLDFYSVRREFGGGMALVQSYIAAPSLQVLLDAGHRWDPVSVLHIARSLLKILMDLQSLHPPIIHRDIKPSNILYDMESKQVYLIDFGSVRMTAFQPGATYTVVGSYGYMPPEQFGGRPVPASDLYGVGATLVALLTGQHPADLPHQGSGLALDQTGLSQILEPYFLDWLTWLLQPNAADRPGSAQIALDALNHPVCGALAADGALLHQTRGIPLPKPAQSRIQLHRTTETLSVIIPGQSGGAGLFILVPFAIAWNSFILFFTVMSVGLSPFPVNLIFGLFTLPFWAAGLWMIGAILFVLFGRLHLSIDPNQIALTYEVFGFRFNRPKPSPRQYINKINLSPSHYKRDSDGDRIEVKSKLEIWAGAKVYTVAGENGLTDPELEWLADQLSRWIKVPITHQ